MAQNSLLNTSTPTFGEIFSNGKVYSVPPYQRDYSWDEEQWEDLWNDIVGTMEGDEKHYMGAVVLQKVRDGEFYIIDGQQRMTTLSILALAVISTLKELIEDKIEPDENLKRVENLNLGFIGSLDLDSLTISSKLHLNEANDPFFQWNLVNHRVPKMVRKLKEAEKSLWGAFLFFKERLRNLPPVTKNGGRLANFLNVTAAKNLLFIQITVEDELNAYTVFETLNARGVNLTPTDLLKNYLFSLCKGSSTDLSNVQTKWARLSEMIGMERFPVFLRHYLNSKQELVPRNSLFKTLKQQVKSQTEVFELLDSLEMNASIYLALDTPEDELWIGEREIIKHIREIQLFKVVLCKPLLMAAFDKWPFDEFKKLLRDTVQLIFRYNLIGRNGANDMEVAFNRAAVKVSNREITTSRQVFEQQLKKLYPDDETFQNDFSTRRFNTAGSSKKIVRYILFNLEMHISQKKGLDFEADPATIEHILPENPSPDWQPFFSDEEYEKGLFMLGNLTLLEAKKNGKEAQNKTFDLKKEIYATSQFQLTQQITATTWTLTMIRHRQESMAKAAKTIWRIPY